MGEAYHSVSYARVAVSALLIVLSGALSLALRLNLGRKLMVASVRMTLQLILVGLVLSWVFFHQRWELVLVTILVMTLAAGYTAAKSSRRTYRGIVINAILTVWISSWLVTAFADFAVVKATPWYNAQYLIPVLGMTLGNSLNGIALSLDRLGEDLLSKKDWVEVRLAHGATRWEAAHPILSNAIATGMLPMINAMMVAGLVSLPGMMTGQLLAGASPLESVKYQIVLMFLIVSTTLFGSIGVVLFGFRQLFNSKHQFLVEKLQKPAPFGAGRES